jgi:hypothetical protein
MNESEEAESLNESAKKSTTCKEAAGPYDIQLTNMLIHLYNGKEPHEFIEQYKTVIAQVSNSPLSRPHSPFTIDIKESYIEG